MKSLTFFVLDVYSKPIFCSNVAYKGKPCSMLLESSCSKVAEHNQDWPIG